MTLTIGIAPRKIALVLGAISVFLAILSITVKVIEWNAGVNNTYWLFQTVELLDMNLEGNLPTWYTTLLLITCAVLLVIITMVIRVTQGEMLFHWGLLSAIFTYLSLDEAAALHERLSIPLEDSLHLSGYLTFGWVVAGIIFVIVVGILYLPFLLRLPARTRWLFILAAVLYVGGAIGIESVSAKQWSLDEGLSLRYSAIGTLEEFCEMLGAVIFIYALLDYLRSIATAVQFQLPARAIIETP
jgi:hypothetical protein